MNEEYEVQRSLGRIEGGLAEIKNDIRLMRDDHAGLRSEFQKLEAGRLTRLESDFSSYKAVAHQKTRQIAVWVSIIIGVAIGVISALIIKFLKL